MSKVGSVIVEIRARKRERMVCVWEQGAFLNGVAREGDAEEGRPRKGAGHVALRGLLLTNGIPV